MSQRSSRFAQRVGTAVFAGMAALAVFTACSGSPERPASAPAGPQSATAEFAGGPAPQDAPKEPPAVQRDIVKTASLNITVGNPVTAADKAAVIATDAGGRVDTRSEDAGSGSGRAHTTLVLRVPAAQLDNALDKLKALGTVDHVEITTDDVTAQRVDLDARIAALQTSVDRLLAIMRDARDPDALIKAEDALSQRQAELDGLRAQRKALGDQIDFSTVTVSFVAETVGGPSPKKYDGFAGQIERGWDGLVSIIGTLILLFGLVLPWLAVLAVVGAVGYGVIRVVKKGRR